MTHFDVIIVGAGLSGIGAAVHLRRRCPSKSFVILESRGSVGGTWDLYRYPGIRSDSDMHTLGYEFKPWRARKCIADGVSILDYVNETADEYDIRKNIRFNRRLDRAAWSSSSARWTLEFSGADEKHAPITESISCNFLLMCTGYYSYDQPHRPALKGENDFAGPMFHPQFWPKELDYRGKRVVVIGSGATAMTIIPAIAGDAQHVTLLQRSPTYVFSRPDTDVIANTLRKLLPENLAYRITRFKNVAWQQWVYKKTRVAPAKVKAKLIDLVRKNLGPDFDVDKHFTPRYNPWDQRLCLIPNSDLFHVINAGKVSVVTDHIDHLTKSAIKLQSGQEIPADIIVIATGLNLKLLGGAQFRVDGMTVNFADTYTYRGVMYSDVPNMVQTFGYINASWTLRADLISRFACRLLNHMDAFDARQCTPRMQDADKGMRPRPWIEGFTPNYMLRDMHMFPKQGEHHPWLNTQNFTLDKEILGRAPLDDGRLIFQ